MFAPAAGAAFVPVSAVVDWSEELTRSLLESAPDAMLITDAEGRIRLYNAQAQWLFGFDRAELVGRPVEVLIPEQFQSRHREHRSSYASRPRVRPMHAGLELWARRKDGGDFPVEVSLSPLHTSAGTFTVAAIRDATGRRRAEQELRDHHARLLDASEKRYYQILETTPDGVWRIDQDDLTDYVNGKMAAIVGYSDTEMLGEPLSRFVDAACLAAVEAEIARSRSTGASVAFESCLRHKSGDVVWCRISTSALMGNDGEVTGSIAVVSDITPSRQRETELRATERLLAASIASISEGLVALDSGGRVTLMNPAAERMLGWTSDELAGRVAHDIVHFQHKDGTPYPVHDCPLTRVWTAGETVVVEDDSFTAKDGEMLPVAYTASPLTSEGIDGSVVIFRDISARKLQERRRAQELEELSWIGRVRDALDENRFLLHAQPILEIATRTVVSYELLLRMIDTNGATIMPGRFLPAAERFDLIGELDRWVAAQAISLATKGARVHFNVSGRSLDAPELISDIVGQLEATGADPRLLVCEITETALAKDTATTQGFVRRLSELGFRIALDDFGSGYGGFTYLKHLQVDYIKIDIAFIRDLQHSPESRHVVAGIVNLARAFGQHTIAEGVENDDVLDLLHELDVDQAQGYQIGKPKPIGTLPAFSQGP
ncbi:MAG: GGDEF domain-containing phosphodiesterase, partial [Solirubrobacteraceae bacterium]